MGFMAEGRVFNDGHVYHWWYQKHSSFPIHNFSDNTNWETSALHMSVTEEAIQKASGRVNAPLEFWGCTNSPRYHVDKFHTYRNCPNKMDPGVADRVKRSIKEYAQRNSAMGGSRSSQGIQYGRGQPY